MLVFAANLLLVSVLGGAELERYLLPILPLFYIAFAVAATALPRRFAVRGDPDDRCCAGERVLFWNPPYPFSYENNYAMVDFVRLQQLAAGFAEHNLTRQRIATAWPYTSALKSADYGFVTRGLKVVETNDFHWSSIEELPPSSYDALIVYTRTWAPQNGAIAVPIIRRFLAHFYEWRPPITAEQCARLGLHEEVSWSLRGQTISIYVKSKPLAGSHRL